MCTNLYFLISNSPCLSPPLAPPAPPGLSATPHSLPLLYPRSNMQQLLHSRNAWRRRCNRLLTFSSCVLILLVSSWAFPAPPSPTSASSSSSSSLSWTNLWKLKKKKEKKRQGGCARLAFEKKKSLASSGSGRFTFPSVLSAPECSWEKQLSGRNRGD